MKGKNLQPRILYLIRLLFRFHGEIKHFQDQQEFKEFNTTKPAFQQMLKEFLQAGNTREGKNLQKQIQKNEQSCNRFIHIDNYLKCKWIKCSNQKSQTGRVDTKTRPIHILSTIDPPQGCGHLQTKVREWQKVLHSNGNHKKAGGTEGVISQAG